MIVFPLAATRPLSGRKDTRLTGPSIAILLAGLMLAVSIVHAAEPQATGDTKEKPEPLRDDRLREEVRVTADVGVESERPVGTGASIVEAEAATGVRSNLTSLLVTVAGVSENGQGGLFQNVSVRGVGRQRIAHRVGAVRITSERRAGPASSFVDPTLLKTVEVTRGPTTTFDGSGALGGVLRVEPRSWSGPAFEGGFRTDGDENYQSFGLGGENWSFGLARRTANDGEAANGTPLHSGFTQHSAVFRADWAGAERRHEFLVIPSWADDIGKDNNDFPQRRTDYPRERHGLAQWTVRDSDGWTANAWFHAQDLRTEVVEADAFSRVDNDTLDYGAGWEQRRDLGEALVLRVGVDLFGRTSVDADEQGIEIEPGGAVVERSLATLDGAEEQESGGFASLRWTRGATRLEGGGRFAWQRQANSGFDSNETTSWSGFFGLSHTIGDRLELAGSVGSGFRFPSLSERFFSGTTARGGVIGNPLLDEERSRNVEASVRWVGRRILLRAAVFRNRVRNYVERVEIEPDLRTFVNLTSGTIEGVELRAIWRPDETWLWTWGGHQLEGRDSDDSPLSDVPPDELFAELQHRVGEWLFELRWNHRFDKNDPGPGEVAIGSAELVAAAIDRRMTESWTLSLGAENLLDDDYFRSADDKANPASGRSFSLRLRWRDG